jgi:hypothetical protein
MNNDKEINYLVDHHYQMTLLSKYDQYNANNDRFKKEQELNAMKYKPNYLSEAKYDFLYVYRNVLKPHKTIVFLIAIIIFVLLARWIMLQYDKK